jgi:hypothetical protein
MTGQTPTQQLPDTLLSSSSTTVRHEVDLKGTLSIQTLSTASSSISPVIASVSNMLYVPTHVASRHTYKFGIILARTRSLWRHASLGRY